jgi:multisubunit Na+/H+ antiporter MnhG subunit
MATIMNQAAAVTAAALRVSMLVLMMTGPVLAVTMMRAENGSKISGAGLVLIVSLERNA